MRAPAPALDHACTASLIASAPLLELLEEWSQDISRLKELFGPADALPHLSLYMRLDKQLKDAIAVAGKVRVVGTVKDAAIQSGRPLSTVRRICKKYRRAAGASRVEGVWSIDIPSFLKFIAELDETNDKGASPRSGLTISDGSKRGSSHRSRLEARAA